MFVQIDRDIQGHVLPHWLLGRLVDVNSLALAAGYAFASSREKRQASFFGMCNAHPTAIDSTCARPLQSNRLTFSFELGKKVTGDAGYADQKVWESDTCF